MMFFWPFIAAFLICSILTPVVRVLALKFGFVDDPSTNKHPGLIHKKITPRAGGVSIYLAVILVTILTVPITQEIIGIFLGGLILIIIGLLDDKREIKSYFRLLAQFAAALVVVASGISVTFVANPLLILGKAESVGGEILHLDKLRYSFTLLGSEHSIMILSAIVAVFWIVWVINMINFSSGVDGQMPGIVIVTLIVIFAASLRFLPQDPSQITVSQLSLIGAGATLGFLIYNFYPAKIFPGDSASYFLGFLVAVCAIISGVKLGTAMLVMAVPLIDGVFTIIRRVASGRSPFRGDRKHLHHMLLDLGWDQRRIALFYYLLCVILGSVALSLHSLQKLFAAAVIFVVVLGGLLWLNMNLSQKPQK